MKKVVVGMAAAVVLLGCGDGDEFDDGNNNDGNNTTYTLTVNRIPTAGGTVMVNGAAYTTPTTHNAGTSVTVMATASANYTFAGWTGASTATTPTMTVTINDNRTLTANFTVTSSGGENQFNPNITYGTLTDSRDGKTYRTVVIGTQTWMAENLNYDTASGSGSWCYDYGNNTYNCTTYGRLYNWNTAMAGSRGSSANPSGRRGVCPEDWHLPSDEEWDVLVSYAGGSSTAYTKLKSAIGWEPYPGVPTGTNEYGFSALPGGRWEGRIGGYDNAGYYSYWWSTTEFDGGRPSIWCMGYDEEYVNVILYYWYNGFSVRCVRTD